jgi:hypothetical protein
MGHIAEMKRRVARALDEADRRGDLFATTELRTASQPLVCLMDDREAAARDVLARAEPDLPRETTTMHWQYLQSSVLTEMYAGAPGKAVEIMDRGMPAIRRAFLLRILSLRAFSSYLQLAAWLGALADGARDRSRLIAAIRRERRRLAGDPVLGPVQTIAGAELAVLRGDLDAAVAGYRAAAGQFDALDMVQLASVTRWRLGELLGGDDGRALIAGAHAAIAAEGVVRPDRIVAALVPVIAQARIDGAALR